MRAEMGEGKMSGDVSDAMVKFITQTQLEDIPESTL